MPGAMLVDIMQETALARAAMAGGDRAMAIGHRGARDRAAGAAALPRQPFRHYPTRQSFAAALLQDGQAARAEQEFFATLVESPDNGWAYWGLAKAREAHGDAAGAEAAMTIWRDAWPGRRSRRSTGSELVPCGRPAAARGRQVSVVLARPTPL